MGPRGSLLGGAALYQVIGEGSLAFVNVAVEKAGSKSARRSLLGPFGVGFGDL